MEGTRLRVTYKVADSESEMEQIHRLNYITFVEEIPQHPPNENGKLVDRFHEENTYFIGLNDDQKVVAMLAVRENRPFSLDLKLSNLDEHLPFQPKKMVEIRLLAIEKTYRKGQIFRGLVRFLIKNLRAAGCDLAVISGTTRELKLYRKFGFVPFADRIGTEEALFQPMYITEDTFSKSEAARLFPEVL
jgi:predicted acetyltransferase